MTAVLLTKNFVRMKHSLDRLAPNSSLDAIQFHLENEA